MSQVGPAGQLVRRPSVHTAHSSGTFLRPGNGLHLPCAVRGAQWVTGVRGRTIMFVTLGCQFCHSRSELGGVGAVYRSPVSSPPILVALDVARRTPCMAFKCLPAIWRSRTSALFQLGAVIFNGVVVSSTLSLRAATCSRFLDYVFARTTRAVAFATSSSLRAAAKRCCTAVKAVSALNTAFRWLPDGAFAISNWPLRGAPLCTDSRFVELRHGLIVEGSGGPAAGGALGRWLSRTASRGCSMSALCLCHRFGTLAALLVREKWILLLCLFLLPPLLPHSSFPLASDLLPSPPSTVSIPSLHPSLFLCLSPPLSFLPSQPPAIHPSMLPPSPTPPPYPPHTQSTKHINRASDMRV